MTLAISPEAWSSCTNSIREVLPTRSVDPTPGLAAPDSSGRMCRLRQAPEWNTGGHQGQTRIVGFDQAMAIWSYSELRRLLGWNGHATRSNCDIYPGEDGEKLSLWDLHYYLPGDILTIVDRDHGRQRQGTGTPPRPSAGRICLRSAIPLSAGELRAEACWHVSGQATAWRSRRVAAARVPDVVRAPDEQLRRLRK